MMSDGTPPPAPHDAIAIDAKPRWLFPLERAPPPPRNEGCILHGLSDPAPLQSNGSSPYSPPIIMMSPGPSSPTSSTCAATSPMQTVPPPDRHTASMDPDPWMTAFTESMTDFGRLFEEEMRNARRCFQEEMREALRDECRRFQEEMIETFRQPATLETFIRLKGLPDARAAPLDTIMARIVHDETVHDTFRRSRTTDHSLQPSANKKITPSPSSTETKSSSPPPPRPTSSSLGKYDPIKGGDPLTSAPDPQASSSSRASTAITPPPMARRRTRPRRRPGRRHRPRAFEAIPSHPVPTMGGNLFRDCGDRPRKRPRRRPHARRVCRRHGPRAPNLGSLRGRRHRPRAPNISPEAS